MCIRDRLYLYGGSPSARHILEAIYDGPIDYRSYGVQAVLLEKIPSLEDGDAYFDTVIVQGGEPVVDVNGRVVDLAEGVQVFRTHTCLDATNPDCVLTFREDPIEMEQMVVSWQLLAEATWSDGQPVTADDSVYSYELACDPRTPASDPDFPAGRELCNRTASYVAAGERAVVWRGLPGYRSDLYAQYFFKPLPCHLWQEQLRYTAADLPTRPESAQQPLGWGPFVITEWVQGDHIAMERNPTYFRAAEGLPRVDRLVFRFAPDVYRVTAMLLAGECDIGLFQVGLKEGDGQLGWPYGEMGRLKPLLIAIEEKGLVNIASSPSNIWESLEFGIGSVETYRRTGFFGDARVRQAIAHCIDRQTIVDETTLRLGQAAEVYIPPQHPLYAGDRLSRWPYDPEAGRALLAEAGWVDGDGDGTLESSGVRGVRDGVTFNGISILVMQGDAQQQTVAHIIRSNLADCGIGAEITYLPWQELQADGPDGLLRGRQFDLALVPYLNEAEPPCGLYLTEEIPREETRWFGANVSGFSDEAYDQACRSALDALPGSYEYERYHLEAQRIFSQQVPGLPLFWWVRLAAVRPGVTNFVLDPADRSQLWGIEEIGLEPRSLEE